MMEAFAAYLFRSVVWLSGFTVIFFLFLRNERYFLLKRVYLISGILASFIFPLITVHYYIELPPVDLLAAGQVDSGTKMSFVNRKPNAGIMLSAFYSVGVLIVTIKSVIQGREIIRSAKRSEIIALSSAKLIRTARFQGSFSFFSYVFVNPSVSEIETREILKHELVHIRQKHWADLVLAQIISILQWFNPLAWLYLHFIRQNHEYLADEAALQRSSDPSVYKAVLLNQIAGTNIFSLSNSFGYSLTKKRFNMMKNIKSSPYRKMKIFFILPVFAAILFAFAKPEYRFPATNSNTNNSDRTAPVQEKIVKGVVLQQNGTALEGAAIIVKNTTIGTTSDSKGKFTIGVFPEGTPLIVSYVGFVSKVVKTEYNSEMKIVMVRDTINIGAAQMPPPPPPPDIYDNGKSPLIIIDGKETKADLKEIDANTIESLNVWHGESAVKRFGEKGRDGVVEIKLRKPGYKENESPSYASVEMAKDNKIPGDAVFVMAEVMPQFPGGEQALKAWIASNTKYPAEAVRKNITGEVVVIFEVTEAGTVRSVKVEKSVNPILDEEAVRVVSSMPTWIPGSQSGKPVNVFMKISVIFSKPE